MVAKPFDGVPKKIPIFGLFLISPETFGRITGVPSASQILIADGKGALAKRMERLQRDIASTDKAPGQLLHSVNVLLDDLDPSDFLATYKEQLNSAVLSGDAVGIARLESEGPWTFLYKQMRSIGEVPTEPSLHERLICSLESLSSEFVRDWNLERFDEALDLLRSSSLAMQVLGEGALKAFKPGRALGVGLMPVRIAAVMEAHLAILTAMIVGRKLDEQGFVAVIFRRRLHQLLEVDNTTSARAKTSRLSAS